MVIRLINETLVLLADIADSLRIISGRPRLNYAESGDEIDYAPGDQSPETIETTAPASKAADAPAPPPAASSQEPEAPAVVKLPEAKELKPEKPRTATKPRRAKKKA
jgi:hypothetical protein